MAKAPTLGKQLSDALVNNQKHLDKIASLESTVKDLEAKLAALRGNALSATPVTTGEPVCKALTDITYDNYWKYVNARRIACRGKTVSYKTYEQWVELWMAKVIPVAPAADTVPAQAPAPAEYSEDFAPVEDMGLDNQPCPF